MLDLTDGLLKDLQRYHNYSSYELSLEIDYVRTRTETEGLSFLTKTLPLLGKALDAALKSGTFRVPMQFKTCSRNIKYPLFLRRLFEKVVSSEGELLGKPCVACIKDIRQVAYIFYKYQLPYEDRLVEATVAEYITLDSDISELSPNAEVQGSMYYGAKVLEKIFQDFSPTFSRPSNGPGAVANRLQVHQRYKATAFYADLDDLFSYCQLYFFNDRHLFDRFEGYRNLQTCAPGSCTARVMVVPKDSRGPRVISCEQSELMTYQQNLKNQVVPFIERHPLTCRQVNFTDQEINGKLALESSKSGEYATLDLSSASDRLSLDLVDGLFENTSIHSYIMKTRANKSVLPNGKTIELRKFAPMGSALCFPIQALSYYALLVGRMMALGESLGVAAKRVWVYGDDIIVPVDFVPDAIEVLESVGLKVNNDKSCYTGKFRESCGIDAFDGIDITPTKLKKLWLQTETQRGKKSVSRLTATTLISWIAACNNLFAGGYWLASDVIRSKVEESGLHLPIISDHSSAIGYIAWSQDHALQANRSNLKWSEDYQCNYLRAKVACSTPRLKSLDGWECLLRWQWDKVKESYPAIKA